MTKLQELNNRLAENTRARQSRRTLVRMASALEAAFLIKPGDSLVCVLGDGTERDNHEALISWLQREIERIESEVSVEYLPELAGRLDKKLTQWELDRGLC